MALYTREQAEAYLRTWWLERAMLEPEFSFDQDKFERTIDLFEALKNEKTNADKSIGAQQNMLQFLAQGQVKNEDIEQTKRHFSDNKHLNYYDEFMENGLSNKILSFLVQNGIPTEALKVVKTFDDNTWTVPKHMLHKGDNRKIEIVQETGDPSNTIYGFSIYINGVKEFTWTRDYDTDLRETLEALTAQAWHMFDERQLDDLYEGQTIKTKKIVDQNGNMTIQEAYFSNEDIKIRKRYAKGTIIDGVKVGGRFIK